MPVKKHLQEIVKDHNINRTKTRQNKPICILECIVFIIFYSPDDGSAKHHDIEQTAQLPVTTDVIMLRHHKK